MNVRTCKNWCAARTLHALHRLGPHLAQVRLPRLLFLMTTTREVRWCETKMWQCHKVKEGGRVFMPSVFFVFVPKFWHVHTAMGRKRKKHRTHVEEESLVRGRFNWRGVRPGRCTMHARHFHAPALHPRPPESIAGAVLAEHTGAVRMPKDAWLGPSNSDSL